MNLEDNNGNTALMYAIKKNNYHIVKFILENVFKNNQTKNQTNVLQVKNSYGTTPLILSIKTRFNNIIQLLIDYSSKDIINVKDYLGNTALIYTCVIQEKSHLNKDFKREDIFKKLMEKGADYTIKNHEGFDVLYYCIEHNFDNLVELIVNKKKKI